MASLEEMMADPGTHVEERRQSIEVPLSAARGDGGAASAAPKPGPGARKAYKNVEMERMIAACAPLLERRDLIGYAAARNTRILRECATEYFERREELIRKYGEPETGADGKPTGRMTLAFSSPRFAEYSAEILQWAEVEHEPEVFRIPASEVIGKLSGSEILELDWMVDDE